MHNDTAQRARPEHLRPTFALVVTAVAALALALATGPLAPAAAQGHGGGQGAGFDNHRQHFNHDTAEWVGSEIDGPTGWCGSIERVDRREGDLAPSTGRAYAVAEGDGCNDFWADVWGEVFEDLASGPFAALTPSSTAWPASGFVVQTDIYLDPDHEDYTGTFDYYVAIFDDSAPDPLYLEVPVRAEEGDLTVNGEGDLTVDGEEVATTGWHTFTHRFSEDPEGYLAVEFELSVKGGPLLFTTDVTETTLFGDGAPLDIAAEDVRSGYVWLHLGDGEQLPIDTYQLRRGR